MRHMLFVVLLVAAVGCGNSGTAPDEQAVKPEADTVESTKAATVEPQAISQNQMQTGEPIVNSIGMNFKLIPSGEFLMGSPESEEGHDDDESEHRVRITKSFELGVHEVTQEQYEQVMETNWSEFKGPQNPVENVSWEDAVEFCRKLSELSAEKSAGYVYRLPTEAEWEYACRAGTKTRYSFGDSDVELGENAWCSENSGATTHPVSLKKPNAWGLYDMHGNVFEWCQDWHADYPSAAVTDDPTGPASGSYRVIRGGGWYSSADYCRSAIRVRDFPSERNDDVGFRVVRSSIR